MTQMSACPVSLLSYRLKTETVHYRTVCILISFLIILAGIGLTGIVTASEPTIVISSYEVRPDVIMPGGSALITVQVSNTAKGASVTKTGGDQTTGQSVTETRDINVYLSDVSLFGNGLRVESGDYRRVGEVGPGQSVPLTFLVQAPHQSGIYFPELHIATEGGRSLKYPIPVNVNDDSLVQKNPALQITKEIPDSVIPGENAEGTLILQNDGDTAASEIIVNISPASPEISVASKVITHISRLGPGEDVSIPLTISTSRKTPEGISLLVCTLRYSTAGGTILTQTEQVPIKISGKPDLAIAAVTSDPVRISEGMPFSLIVRIENTGTGDANGVRAVIDAPVKGTKEAFVGKIEPDNDGPAVFYLQEAPAGDYQIPIMIRMEHEGTEYVMDDTLSLTIAPRGNPLLIPAVIILCLIGGGIVVYRRRESEPTV